MSTPPEDQVELFPLTTHEDTDEEAARKIVRVLRRFGGDPELVDEIIESIEAEGRECHLQDLIGYAIGELYGLTPKRLQFGYHEEIEGYAFCSKSEAKAAWKEQWKDTLDNLAKSEVPPFNGAQATNGGF